MSKFSREKKKKKKEELKKLGLLPMDFCRSCGEQFVKEELKYGPCPFQSEIYGIMDETVLCENCYYEACMDI